MKKIIFRSCGGLGNQIFQMIFVKSLSKYLQIKNIVHYHATNYERIALWEYPSEVEFIKPGRVELFIIRLRIPMVFRRIGLNKKGYIRLLDYYFVDGYYQSCNDYNFFDRTAISFSLQSAASELINHEYKIKYNNIGRLYHLRLGDLYKSEEDQINFVDKTIDEFCENSFLISNRDDLFVDKNLYFNILYNKNINYMPTNGMSGLELFNLLYFAEIIHSNGSSLSFAASILSGNNIVAYGTLKESAYHYENFTRLEGLKNFFLNEIKYNLS